ncbi:MAG: hypothetical protein KAR17_01835 [Cyclobacteriaceae bacterium]|nr:hypothetical protein [Cyclobacteriaceae bacterium]
MIKLLSAPMLIGFDVVGISISKRIEAIAPKKQKVTMKKSSAGISAA